jgi:hypothetical protein
MSKPPQPIRPGDVVAQLRRVVHSMPKHAPKRLWTVATLGALAELAGPGVCVEPAGLRRPTSDGHSGESAREFLWDLVLSTFPRTTYPSDEFLDRALAPGRLNELLLVANCEWGRGVASTGHVHDVFDRFIELTAARAELKAMVFGYHDKRVGSLERLCTMMHKMIASTRDEATYVLFGVGWRRGQCGYAVATPATDLVVAQDDSREKVALP